MSLENVGNAFVKSRNVRIKNKLPKDLMQKHTAKELTTQLTCAGIAQTGQTDLTDTKVKIITIQ